MKGKLGQVLFNIVVSLIFLAGIGVMLYPRISDWVNAQSSSKVMLGYEKAVESLSEEDYTAVFENARDYNRRLKDNPSPFTEPEATEGYAETLNVSETGIMGYVTIEKIRVRLPFYHGTDQDVLQKAIGHLEGTSLPTGDKGEHVVLSAHRGLPTAKLFTDLPDLVEGDTFVLNVLDQKYTYEVDQILTVLPNVPETFEALSPVEGMDLCTLMTCTPYGINTHRLLVRGHRVGNAEELPAAAQRTEKKNSTETAETDAGKNYDRYIPYAVGAAVVIFLGLMLAPVKKKK